MKLFKRKLSVIKEETPVEKIRLEDGELEAVSGGVVEGQTLVCEDCLKPYTFTRGNFSTESLCNDCAIAKYLTKPEDGCEDMCLRYLRQNLSAFNGQSFKRQ